MKQLTQRMEIPILLTLFLAGCGFLLKMCYLSLFFNTVFSIFFLAAFRAYVQSRHGFKFPLIPLLLVFAAVQVDALGNYFHMYGNQFGPMQYDEFSHMTVPALVTPSIVWLTVGVFERLGYRLPVGLTSLFAAATIFSLSAFYEIIELWDEVYFNGHRIWNIHDTANDLQWDLCGIIIGFILANLILPDTQPKRLDSENSESA